MKKTALIITVTAIAWFIYNSGKKINSPQIAATGFSGNITITGAFALYPVAVKWAVEFKKINPGVTIDISAGGAGKGITDVLSGVSDIGLVSRNLNTEEIKKGAYPFAVAKDAVVPTVSANNPLLNDLLAKGIKKAALNAIFITGNYKNWGEALNITSSVPIHVYTRADAAGGAETWADFFSKKQEDLQGIGVYGDPGLAQAVKRDPVAIGFNNMVYVYDPKTKKQANGVIILPLDLDNNGKIDPEENFYNTQDQLIAAIAGGKYPAPPARNLYFVTAGKPQNKTVNAFIRFVLAEGQKYVQDAGYIKLNDVKIKEEQAKLQAADL